MFLRLLHPFSGAIIPAGSHRAKAWELTGFQGTLGGWLCLQNCETLQGRELGRMLLALGRSFLRRKGLCVPGRKLGFKDLHLHT